MKSEELAEILYKEELTNWHKQVEGHIEQIRLLYSMYRRMKSLLIEVEPIPFYNMLKSIYEFDGMIEDIIESLIPRYIEDLDVDYNNPKDWIDFICQDDFSLEDLETGKIKFTSVKDVKI